MRSERDVRTDLAAASAFVGIEVDVLRGLLAGEGATAGTAAPNRR